MSIALMLSIALVFALVVACAVAGLQSWHRKHFMRIPNHKLDWTSGQFASKDWK